MLNLIPNLQVAIGPAILISGVGLLLLTMTNRLGRVIDQARILDTQLPQVGPVEKEHLIAQLQILWRRAQLIRRAILMASASALASALLIIALFFNGLWPQNSAWIIVGALFICGIASLIISLILFIQEVDQSLAALKRELSSSGMGGF
jgi:Na+/melibiose symporter-like transporter